MISSRLRPPSIEALREAVHRCPASKFSKGAIRSDFTFPKCTSCRYQSATRNCPPLAVTALSVAAQAQEDWQIDPKDSVATLSLGEGVNTLQIGLTRVTGYVEFRSERALRIPWTIQRFSGTTYATRDSFCRSRPWSNLGEGGHGQLTKGAPDEKSFTMSRAGEMCINWELKSKGKIRPRSELTTIAGLEQT